MMIATPYYCPDFTDQIKELSHSFKEISTSHKIYNQIELQDLISKHQKVFTAVDRAIESYEHSIQNLNEERAYARAHGYVRDKSIYAQTFNAFNFKLMYDLFSILEDVFESEIQKIKEDGVKSYFVGETHKRLLQLKYCLQNIEIALKDILSFDDLDTHLAKNYEEDYAFDKTLNSEWESSDVKWEY